MGLHGVGAAHTEPRVAGALPASLARPWTPSEAITTAAAGDGLRLSASVATRRGRGLAVGSGPDYKLRRSVSCQQEASRPKAADASLGPVDALALWWPRAPSRDVAVGVTVYWAGMDRKRPTHNVTLRVLCQHRWHGCMLRWRLSRRLGPLMSTRGALASRCTTIRVLRPVQDRTTSCASPLT